MLVYVLFMPFLWPSPFPSPPESLNEAKCPLLLVCNHWQAKCPLLLFRVRVCNHWAKCPLLQSSNLKSEPLLSQSRRSLELFPQSIKPFGNPLLHPNLCPLALVLHEVRDGLHPNFFQRVLSESGVDLPI